jgi:hypothetical protein
MRGVLPSNRCYERSFSAPVQIAGVLIGKGILHTPAMGAVLISAGTVIVSINANSSRSGDIFSLPGVLSPGFCVFWGRIGYTPDGASYRRTSRNSKTTARFQDP